MKKFTLAVIAVAFATASMAQAIPNWTKTATPGSGGQSYTLHTLLSQGNAVLLDFMATWCGPCQASTPSINSLWMDYGQGAGGFYAFAMDVDNSETAAQLDAFGNTYGGDYPAFIQCSSDYGYYDANFSPNPGYIPLFILLEPNTGNPAASTVAWSQVGWGTGQEVTQIKAALAGMGIFPTGMAGIDEPAQGVSVYPNPATENFSVYFKNIENVNVDIFNITGQVMSAFNNVNRTLTVNTVDYTSGIYFVRVSEQDGTVISTYKVNVQK